MFSLFWYISPPTMRRYNTACFITVCTSKNVKNTLQMYPFNIYHKLYYNILSHYVPIHSLSCSQISTDLRTQTYKYRKPLRHLLYEMHFIKCFVFFRGSVLKSKQLLSAFSLSASINIHRAIARRRGLPLSTPSPKSERLME